MKNNIKTAGVCGIIVYWPGIGEQRHESRKIYHVPQSLQPLCSDFTLTKPLEFFMGSSLQHLWYRACLACCRYLGTWDEEKSCLQKPKGERASPFEKECHSLTGFYCCLYFLFLSNIQKNCACMHASAPEEGISPPTPPAGVIGN